MTDRDALARHGVFCVSLAAAMAAGVVLIFLLGFVLLLISGIITLPRAGAVGSGMLISTVLSMKAGAVLGAVVGCWALHRLSWRCDDTIYRRRCSAVGLVLMVEIVTAAALILGIALVQPMMSVFWSPVVLLLISIAWLVPVVLVGHVIWVWLTARLMSAPVRLTGPGGRDTPQNSARQMIAGLVRLAMSPVVAIKVLFQGFAALLQGCIHVDLGNSGSTRRKEPPARS